MAEVEISYKGSNIATMNASGTKTLLTEAKYLEDDVTITYARPTAPSGTKNISITANGVTTEDVTNYASAQITANVPNTYAAADEGKVVDDGALVAQTSRSIDTNGTYDTTTNNEVVVNVSGGGGSGSAAELIQYIRVLGAAGLNGAPIPEKAFFAKLTDVGQSGLTGITGNKVMVFPVYTGPNSTRYPFSDNHVTETFDFGPSMGNIGYGYLFSGNREMKTLIIRKASVVTLNNLNDFNATPFASGGSGGTLYVPADLISSYQGASNWSTILGYSNNQIKSIESTHTDPTAPIDLTLYYADGTPIPTT